MRYLSVEGNIGAGKSSVIEGLSRALRTPEGCIIPDNMEEEAPAPNIEIMTGEPVGSWMKILPRFYERPAEHALELQMEILKTRLLQIRDLEDELLRSRPSRSEPCSAATTSTPVLLERCPESSSLVFVPCLEQEGYLSPEEKETYLEWYDLTKRLSGNELAGVVYVYATPEVCFERVRRRNREGEAGVTLEYLKLLDKGYQKWLELCRNADVPVHVIDANQISVEQATRRALSAISSFSVTT